MSSADGWPYVTPEEVVREFVRIGKLKNIEGVTK